ncbi:MAG: hypothetical protein V3T19_12450 [Acidiferrobacterales bacterium]
MQRVRYTAILAAIALLLTGPNLGLAEEKESSNVRWGFQPLHSKYLASFDFGAERAGELRPAAGEPLYSKGVALAAEKPSQTGAAAAGAEPAEELSEECLAFQQDPTADLGDVLRAGCKPTLGQMSKLMDNPLGNVAMWINQVDWYRLKNDTFNRHADQVNYMGIIQFPKGISEDYNIINRIVYNVTSSPLDQGRVDRLLATAPAVPPGGGPVQPPVGLGAAPIDFLGGRTTGFGDMYYVGLLSPKEGIKHEGGGSSVWGAGVDLAFPTATKDVLGTGKWSAGPSALYAYLGPKWKVGALWQQYFSFAGDSDRADVNLSNIQYFVYYSIDEVTSIGAGPNIIADWEQNSGDRWTVPIGIGINRTFQFGKVPVRIGIEFHYSVVRPDNLGAEWDVRFYVIPAVPAALFKWLD